MMRIFVLAVLALLAVAAAVPQTTSTLPYDFVKLDEGDVSRMNSTAVDTPVSDDADDDSILGDADTGPAPTDEDDLQAEDVRMNSAKVAKLPNVSRWRRCYYVTLGRYRCITFHHRRLAYLRGIRAYSPCPQARLYYRSYWARVCVYNCHAIRFLVCVH